MGELSAHHSPHQKERRFCIDFRKLNEQTKKDAYLLPHMQEQMESMVGAKHFSCIDLKSGFWQVKRRVISTRHSLWEARECTGSYRCCLAYVMPWPHSSD